jgi:hypothetical protein
MAWLPACSSDEGANSPASGQGSGGAPTPGSGGLSASGGTAGTSGSSAGGVAASGGSVSGGSGNAGSNSGGSASPTGGLPSSGGERADGGVDEPDGGSPTSAGAGDAPVGTPCVNPGATVTATQTAAQIQQVINGQPAGATICFESGLYRLSAALAPKQGQTLHGEAGAILSGAVVVSGFAASGSAWVANDVKFVSTGSEANAEPWCEDLTTHLCSYDEWAFVDGAPLARVTTRDAVKAGTFYNDYAAKALYLGTNPAGHLVELGSTRAGVQVKVADCVVEGLTFEKFASQFNHGALEVTTSGANALIQNVEARRNHYSGIVSWANGTTIRFSRLHDNGALGINTSSNTGTTVDHVDVVDNNNEGFWRIDGAAGGIKINLSRQSRVTNSVIRGNQNNGIWYDEGADDSVVDGNVIDANFHNGVMFEVSRVIRISGNVVTNNGLLDRQARGHTNCTGPHCAAGIFVNDGATADIFDNTVRGNIHSIVLGQASRTPRTPEYTIPNVTGVHVHHNTIDLTMGNVGLVYGAGPPGFDPYAASSDNYFKGNTYRLPSRDAAVFYWQKALGSSTRWQSLGQDLDGSFAY